MFNGFSPHEIRLATDKSEIRTNQVKKEHQARGVLFTPYAKGRNPLLPVSSLVTSSINRVFVTQNQDTVSLLQSERSNSPKPLLHKNRFKFQRNVDHLDKTKEMTPQSKAKDTTPEVKCRFIAKGFVLPVRSAHSSRMIKPNKRFRDVDGASSDQSNSLPKKMKLSSENKICSSSSWINETGMLAASIISLLTKMLLVYRPRLYQIN